MSLAVILELDTYFPDGGRIAAHHVVRCAVTVYMSVLSVSWDKELLLVHKKLKNVSQV